MEHQQVFLAETMWRFGLWWAKWHIKKLLNGGTYYRQWGQDLVSHVGTDSEPNMSKHCFFATPSYPQAVLVWCWAIKMSKWTVGDIQKTNDGRYNIPLLLPHTLSTTPFAPYSTE